MRRASRSPSPANLIHIEVDPHEIGKNYPAEVGIVADAAVAVGAIADTVPERSPSQRSEYLAELGDLQRDWEQKLAGRRDSDRFPFTSQRPLGALRNVLGRDAIIVAGSGSTQGAVKQTSPVYQPRTHLTSGGFSSMGWAIPAAVGAKIERPDRDVVCVVGDGDFLMTSQEIALSVTNDVPVVDVVQNNAGYMSIRGGQRKQTSRHVGTEFNHRDGLPYSPDFKALGTAFGIESWKVIDPAELEATLKKAVDSRAPALVEDPTDRDAAGPWVPGWWDFPSPPTSPTSASRSTPSTGPGNSTCSRHSPSRDRRRAPSSTRTEHDLLGDREVPAEAYYGVHTLRASENFVVSNIPISTYPGLVEALAAVKHAAGLANRDLGCSTNSAPQPSPGRARRSAPAPCTSTFWSTPFRAGPAHRPT